MVSLEVALQNVMKTNYTNASYIQELELLQNIVPIIHTDAQPSPQSSIHRVLSSIKTPFAEIGSFDESILNSTIQVLPYHTIQSPSNISPFQLCLIQLSESNQSQMIRKIHTIRQTIQAILFVFYTMYDINQDSKTTIYFQIRNFLQMNQLFLTPVILQKIIHRFVLNSGKELQTFRTKLFNTLQNSMLIRFIAPKHTNDSSIILTLFNTIIGRDSSLNLLHPRIRLYLRYIRQFIQAPFMNEYKELKMVQTLSQVLGLDESVFVHPSFIREFKQTNRRFPYYR